MDASTLTRKTVSLLVGRIQRAGFLSDVDVSKWPEEALPEALGLPLFASLKNGWKHVCQLERIVHIPAAVIVPCDLSKAFKCIYDGKWLDFEFKPAEEVQAKPYYLRDIYVLHDQDRELADQLVRRGDHDLTFLECLETLLQTAERFPTEWGECSTGSLTSRDAGIPVEGETGPRRLQVCLDHRWVSGRSLHRCDPKGSWPWSNYHHHVALCRERIDLLGSFQTPLGMLKRISIEKEKVQ